MKNRTSSILFSALVAFGLAVFGHLALPPVPVLASSSCGAYSGPLCSKNTSCVKFLWYEQCTTKYTYYPELNVD